MTEKSLAIERVVSIRQSADLACTRGQWLTALGLLMEAFELDEDDSLTLSAIDSLCRNAPDPRSLLTVDAASRSLFRRAVRARLMIQVGDRLEGTKLMLTVVEAAPHRSFASWLASWLDQDACWAIGLPGVKPAVLAVVEFAAGYPISDSGDLSDTVSSLLKAGANMVLAIRRAYPHEPPLYSSEVLIRRRLNEPQLTLSVARSGVDRFPKDWACLTAMTGALIDVGRLDEALLFAERALEVEPADGSPLYDVGVAFLAEARSGAAADIFSRLLRLQPNYPGAAEALGRARALSELAGC